MTTVDSKESPVTFVPAEFYGVPEVLYSIPPASNLPDRYPPVKSLARLPSSTVTLWLRIQILFVI